MKAEVLDSLIENVIKALPPEDIEALQNKMLKEFGEKFLTSLGEARSAITFLSKTMKAFPESQEINKIALSDTLRFLDATAAKFMETVGVDASTL